jgi:hypothetical protein
MADTPAKDPRDDDDKAAGQEPGDDKEQAEAGSKAAAAKSKAAREEDDEPSEAAKPKAAAAKSKAAREEDDEPSEAAKPKAAAAKGAKPPAKPAEPGFLTPTNVALLLAAGGLAAFWKGWDLYRTPGKDFYSGSAWLFLIAFFLVSVSAFHFLGAQMRGGPGEKPKKLLEALVPCLPFFALYAVVWWSAWESWKAMYGATSNRWMIMFFGALAVVSWGVWWALRPPSPEDIKADRLPTRRVIMLLMLPFVTVFGMIWLAERGITR